MTTYDKFMANEEQFWFQDFVIPTYMRQGLYNYIHCHFPCGNFLRAVLKNDLAAAVCRADDNNLHSLPAYISFLYNHAPSTCWGSTEKYENWVSKKETNHD